MRARVAGKFVETMDTEERLNAELIIDELPNAVSAGCCRASVPVRQCFEPAHNRARLDLPCARACCDCSECAHATTAPRLVGPISRPLVSSYAR